MEDFSKHEIYISEYITGNRFIDACEKNRVPFCKTDFLTEYTNTEQSVFVTHNSDYHIEENRFSYIPKNVTKWFAQNKDYKDSRLIGIPIGLENMNLRINMTSHLGKYSSQPQNSLEKAVYINGVAKEKLQHKNLVYLNINPKTYPVERQRVLDLFQNESWVTNKKNISWKEYYRDIASHKFVFSPRGNGVDCHRTWEALYLRTIPIVKESIAMNEFKDLPILFVKNWEDINYNYLSKKYEEMSSKLYDLSKMKISGWENIIKEYINE